MKSEMLRKKNKSNDHKLKKEKKKTQQKELLELKKLTIHV